MSVNEAIEKLERMQKQIIHGSNIFGDIAAILREAKEIIEQATERRRIEGVAVMPIVQRAERWLKE